jgi:hypothetical protein
MRTTLDIDDDVLAAARSIARDHGRSIGAVVSELARQGLHPSRPSATERRGVPLFRVSPDSPIVTDDDVKRALDEGW